MKLFITNKSEFEEDFSNSKQIHQKAFNQLKKSVDVSQSIPLYLCPEYRGGANVLFDFLTRKEDTYYYEYSTTVS